MRLKNILNKQRTVAVYLGWLILAISLVSCKTNEKPTVNKLGENEFVVTHQAAVNEQQLRTLFKSVEPFSIVSSTQRMTVIRFSYTPEQENLEKIVESSDLLDAIQPNYRYQKLR